MNFWIQLFELAIHRRNTREDYSEFQEFQANRVIHDIKTNIVKKQLKWKII